MLYQQHHFCHDAEIIYSPKIILLAKWLFPLLPPFYIMFTRLRYLDVAYNNISDMPPNFATMRVLKYLSIGGNNIRYFGEEITSIRAMEYLDISHNKLQVRFSL